MHQLVADACKRHPSLDVAELSALNQGDVPGLQSFLQSDTDVHGSHGLFYWLRSRGRGCVIVGDHAAMVLTWRPDVGRLVALRPMGERDAIVELVVRVGNLAMDTVPDVPFVTRYCNEEVTNQLLSRDWSLMTDPWLPGSPSDDEAFPEVLVTAAPVEIPGGPPYKSIRESIFRHGDTHEYRVSATPLGGEEQFIRNEAARAAVYDDHEHAFNEAVISSLNDSASHYGRTYHYLTTKGELVSFAITANTTGISHGYFLCSIDVPRLTTFFLWNIYLYERSCGAFALNLGGSESESLHTFKTRTFPDHELQPSKILQRPNFSTRLERSA